MTKKSLKSTLLVFEKTTEKRFQKRAKLSHRVQLRALGGGGGTCSNLRCA
jgi:hypothetical protein